MTQYFTCHSVCPPRISSPENPNFGLMYLLYEMPYIFALNLEIIVKNQNSPLRTTSPVQKICPLFVLIYKIIIWSSDQFQSGRGIFHLKCGYWQLCLCVEVGYHYCLRRLCNTYLTFTFFSNTKGSTIAMQKLISGVNTLIYPT